MSDTVAGSPELTAEEVSNLTRQTNYGTWRFQKTWKPLYIADAEGCWITDGAGKRYLDFSAQLMCVNLGHKNPRVVESIAEQARELAFVGPVYATSARAKLSAKLLEVLPAGLEKFFFATSGTEANEAAFKIARMYTGKNKIISRYRSYHGSTSGSIAATGDPRRWAMEPAGKGIGFVFAPETNCYDCPIKHTYPSCNVACADYIEHMIRNESDVAAIILEPVVGTNGVLIPPPEYFPRLREICDRHGVLMIADEVMTGWGRTGKWFAVDHWDVVPDIITMAKGINSGYVPLGAMAIREPIAEWVRDKFFAGGLTYSGHPLACATGVASIEAFREEGIVEHAAEMGPVFEAALNGLAAKHPSIGEVRGIGCFWGLELVTDRETREPLVPFNAGGEAAAPVARLAKAALDRGLYLMTHWNVIMVCPPLTITREELEEGISILDDVLAIADEYYTG
jgi:taurine--2-oxoglutarate transaminase